MEGRPSRGRGGSWKRGGGRGGNDGDGSGGEHRGRGRGGGGGHHRGRGKRDHYRGRGRGGGGGPAVAFHHRDQDDGDLFQDEDDRMETFSRRKLESNWDRYEESEKQEAEEDTPAQRGTDYHVLLGSAGDSFAQFRFSEEKDWEMDSSAACQMSSVFLDLPALAQTLQQVPLHHRLNLEAELVQLLTPVDLPAVTLMSKQETAKTSVLAAPSAAFNITNPIQKPSPVSGSESKVSSGAALRPALEKEEEDDDEELDQLLSLQKPVSGSESVSVSEESAAPDEACEDMKEVTEEETEEVKDTDVTPLKCGSVKQEVTEEDLEDWLDSMIS